MLNNEEITVLVNYHNHWADYNLACKQTNIALSRDPLAT